MRISDWSSDVCSSDLVGGDYFLGENGQRALRPVLNVTAGDHWSARVAGNFSRDDGVIHNTDLDRPEINVDQNTVRARLRYDDDRLRADLGAFYSAPQFNANNFQLIQSSAPTLALMRQYDPQVDDIGTGECGEKRGK